MSKGTYSHSNRHRMHEPKKDKAMHQESEWDTIEINPVACLKHSYAETKHIKKK